VISRMQSTISRTRTLLTLSLGYVTCRRFGDKADDKIPNSSLTTLCTVPPLGGGTSATLVANTTAISGTSPLPNIRHS
jgi:hypothetical protein